MNRLFLLRHAETDNNRLGIIQRVDDGVTITAEAEVDLRCHSDEVTAELGDKVVILCSSALRARQTLNAIMPSLIARGKRISVTFTDKALEVNFGDFAGQRGSHCIDGMSMAHYKKLTTAYYKGHADAFRFPGGEHIHLIDERVEQIIKFARNAHKIRPFIGSDIVILGHSRLFRHLLFKLGAVTPDEMFEVKLPHAKLLKVDMASCEN